MEPWQMSILAMAIFALIFFVMTIWAGFGDKGKKKVVH